MQVIRSIKEMQAKIREASRNRLSVGYVPTMGFFHEGHLALMKQAKHDHDVAVASIFVNPLQFGPNEDFDAYPRDELRDIRLGEENGIDILFIPDAEEMYPENMIIQMDITDRTDVLCGAKRPGHFAGVITVLTKLFNIIQPDCVYFGMKDAQQVAVVDALITQLNFPVQLVALPTVREDDGLARSSRNVNLSTSERKSAPSIYKAIEYGRSLVVDGEKNPAIIVKEVANFLEQETNAEIDYVDLLQYPALKRIECINQQIILAVAVKYESVRLIDNVIMTVNGNIVNRLSQGGTTCFEQ